MHQVESPNCHNCGAPLSINPAQITQAVSVPCGYCGGSTILQPLNPSPPPPQASPPPISSAMASAHLHQANQVAVHARGRVLTWVIVLGVLLPGLIPLMIFAGPKLMNAVGLERDLPLECELNEEIEIEDRDVELDRPAITGSLNCTITIRNSKISAPRILKLGSNAKIRIEDSTLTAEEVAIEAESNPKIDLRNSTISSEEVGVLAGANLELKMRDSSVTGAEAAIRAHLNADVDIRKESTVKSKGTGIETRVNAELRIDNSRLEGGKLAFDLGSNADVDLIAAEVIGERRRGSNFKINER